MSIKAVLFDKDNTLTYTHFETYMCPTIEKTLEALGKSYGTPAKNYEFAEKLWFGSGKSKLIEAELKIEPKKFWDQMWEFDTPEKRCDNTEPFYDIDFLDDLKEAGYKVGLVTASTRKIGQPVVDKIGAHRFDCVVYVHKSEGIRHKPDPQGIEIALKQLETLPEDAAYVGDTPGDMETAKNAKVLPIFIDRKTHFIKHNVDVPLKVTSLYCIGHFLGMEGY